jgi:outer membrane protein assembly complex protein YaeT
MFVFFAVASLVHAQQAAAPPATTPSLLGRPIARVSFQPADQPLPVEELLRLLPFRSGDRLSMADVRAAIQRLYETGRFHDITVEAIPDGSGVALTFVAEPAYFISRVRIEGEREPPNRNQLVTATQLTLGASYFEDAAQTGAGRIQERLQANGFFQAAVRHRTELVRSTGEALVSYSILAGKRARFGGVDFRTPGGEPLPVLQQKQLARAADWRKRLAFLPLPGWRPVTESRLQSGIENLRRRLQGEDRLLARVSLERLHYEPARNIVKPVITVEPGPTVEVRVNGADLSRQKIRQLIPIFEERTVDRSLLLEGQRNLAEHFQSEGYFDAQVRFTETQAAPDRSLIEYQVARGDKHKLRGISISGNLYFDTATLRERMFIQPASLLRFRQGRYSPRLLNQDLEAIRALYVANGFRDVQVTAEIREDPLRHSDITLHIQILEGRQWLVNRLSWSGVDPADEKYLLSVIRSTEGQPFSPANVAADRDTILTYFFNRGYPNATFTWTQAEGPSEGLMDLSFTVQPGPRQYVRGVLIRGLEATNPALVASRITLQEGDALSQSQISASQQRLYDLGIFAKVQTALQNPEGRETSKYVLFAIDEARKYSFNFGVGAELARIGGGTTTLTAPAGAAGFAPRVSLGLSRINFLGVGHTISLQTLASTQQRRALLNYLAPQFQGNPNLALTVSALFNDARDVRTFAARRWEGSVQLSQRVSRSDTVQLRVTFRRVTLDPNSLKISPESIPLLSRPVRVGLVGGTFFRDRRDDPVDSHRGAYHSLDVALATPALASQTSFTRLLARNSTYHPLTREIVLARSLQFGYIGRFGGLPEIPLAERFFAGGAASQRAFPDNQAGPRDLRSGFPVGGTALLFHSTELRFPLIGDNLGGVVFHDMGNVYSEVEKVSFRVRQRNLQDFDYMVHAAGAGIRYRTPVGPIRVDLAYGPNAPRFFGFAGTLTDLLNVDPATPLCAEGAPNCTNQRIRRFQFHFSLGQTF